jgi:hypothetical protein
MLLVPSIGSLHVYCVQLCHSGRNPYMKLNAFSSVCRKSTEHIPKLKHPVSMTNF